MEHVWRLVEAEQITISTKHEGELVAHRVMRLIQSASGSASGAVEGAQSQSSDQK
jgi:hypothetical protein